MAFRRFVNLKTYLEYNIPPGIKLVWPLGLRNFRFGLWGRGTEANNNDRCTGRVWVYSKAIVTLVLP